MDGLMQAEAILRGTGLEIVRQGIGIAVPVGQKLTIMRGDIVRMNVSFDYRGIALTGLTLRCSIGQRVMVIGFDEIAFGQASVDVAESIDFVGYTVFADIDTSPIESGANYDIEAKIEEYVGDTLVSRDDVIDVIGAPEFTGFSIDSYDVV
ncbi:unnamed protein product [marine sediment metagenome]|uniref:Uncharacterized protein n=1 Tax=marine sediment metagenome TaxID=412755 RepID=X1RUV2_9ZZZZ